MKLKKVILGLAAFTFMAIQTCALAQTSDATIKAMVAKYKQQNYLGCIQDTKKILKDDPSNIYAYYYKGLSYFQLGQHEQATEAFTNVENLNSNETLVKYATRAKACIEMPEACSMYAEGNKTELDKFIESNKFYDTPVQAEVNKKKLDRVRNNINDAVKEDLNQNKTEAQNPKSEMPTNEEIANAVKTLAKLGINPMGAMVQPAAYQNPEMMQMSMLLGNNTQTNNGMNMLPFLMMNQGNTQNMSPELIETMMMNQMAPTY